MLLLVTFLLGCGEGDTDRPDDEQLEPAPPAVAAPAVPNTDSADASGSAATAVRTALDGFAAGRPLVLWEALPAGHRGDVTSLVHAFAGKIDDDSWTDTTSTLRRTATLMRDRRAWFLSHPRFADPATVDDGVALGSVDPVTAARQNWDAAASLLDTVADGQLADRAAVANLDVAAFLGGNGREIAQQLLALAGPDLAKSIAADVGRLKIETVAVNGDRATLRIGGGAFEPTEHEFVRVDGRWLPANVAENWEPTMRNARARLDAWTFDAKAWQVRLADWTTTLADLDTAPDEATFHTRLDNWLATVVPSAPEPPTPGPTPDGTVVVEVPALLDLAGEDRVQLLLNTAAADSDLAVSIPTRQGEATLFEVSHAGRPAEFAERLRKVEGVTVEGIDETTGRVRVTITAE